jgi:signal transduction histidine kinase
VKQRGNAPPGATAGSGEHKAAVPAKSASSASAAAQPADAVAPETVRREAIFWLLSGLTHESRNALQQIGACAEMLAIQLADRPAALDLVRGVEEAQAQLVRVLDDLRAFSAPLQPDCRPLDLVELWRHVWQDLTDTGRWPRAELRQTAVPIDAHCQADAKLLGRALTTLLEHALDAAPPPAMIEIACHEMTLAEQPAWMVIIGSYGRELAPEEQRQLFEPFFYRRSGESGLGMAIARRLAELHGGGVEAQAAAGCSRLVLRLPKTGKPAATRAAAISA